ncbi:MAG: nodulation protein NfeD [Gammaproteobacteria bacterium]|nr:nodulation protein NfeD [Gammaproteobacteria bacterium]
MDIRTLCATWRFPPRSVWLAPLLLLAAVLALPGHALGEGRQVWVLELDGPIGPASSDYITRNLAAAEEAGVELFVIRMDTPGGLDSSMRDIIRAILDADVPVATWVAPGGSRAASAGTYILYASHIAAMAPATNLGAATPVAMGGGSPIPMPGGSDDEDEDEREEGSGTPATASERKAINDAVAYIRGLAELRGRNADWAEAAVREAVSLSASAALEANVIDLIAKDVETLLAGLDGRSIVLERSEVTLDLANAEVMHIEPDWRSEFLALITNPNIAYILLMIGIYGLILEFYNPGLGIPGVTGIICLLLAFYALQMLPISYVGVALLIIGIALMITEAFAPSFGVFGIGGAVAFIIGSVMLMDSDLPGYQISLPLIAAFAAGSIAIFVFSIGAALRARKSQVVSGREAMIGLPAVAVSDFEPEDGMEHGRVRVHGEIWQAESSAPIVKGQHLRVAGLNGLVVQVEAEVSPEPVTN